MSRWLVGRSVLVLVAVALVGAASFKVVQVLTLDGRPAEATSSVNSAGGLPIIPAPENFDQKVLHWQISVYRASQPTSVTDVWLDVGNGNTPLLSRATTTVAGSFVNAVFYDYRAGTMTRIANQRVVPSSAPGCGVAERLSPQALARLTSNALPSYLDSKQLAAAGFTDSDFRFGASPASLPGQFGNPDSTVPVGAVTTKEGESSVLPGGRAVIQVGAPDGRLVAWATLNASGEVQQEEITGPIEAFTASRIPASFFSASSFSGGCK